MTRLRPLPFLLFLCVATAAAGEARWIRYPAISPDAASIAFAYRGDLWVVSAEGGLARPLTTHVGYEFRPVWSPDGRWIAFASDRHGNFDLFVIPATGGASRRLTFHSANDYPCCFSPDSRRVLFSSRRQDAPGASIGSSFLPELYSIPVTGGRPLQVLTTPAEKAQLSPDGARLVYMDLKGYENRWRKHHKSPVARDIWIWERATGRHTRITTFRGEDRDPVWAPGAKEIYYLSERGGNFNVWKRSAAPGGAPIQVTRHGPHPVRFLTIAKKGTLAYAYNGELWIKRPGAAPERLVVQAAAAERRNPSQVEVLRKGATQFAVSPEEEEVAFVVRGEIFTASIKHGTTRRITHTPQQERSPSWAPDGRTLYYAAERDGSWDIFKTSLVRKEEKRFFLATTLREEPVLTGPDETFRPKVSPDGKQLAYLFNRDEIRVLDLATKKSKVLVPADRNYSYADGDISFAWSPDSRWLAFGFLAQGRWNDDVGVGEVATGRIEDLTLSGYDEGRPLWSADSGSLLFYSNRLGRRSHGGWGSEGDIFAIDLTRAAHDKALRSQEEYELSRKDKGEDEEEGKRPFRGRRGRRARKKKRKPPQPVRIEFQGVEDRMRRLTLRSTQVAGYALSPDGETLVYFAQMDGKWDLWINRIRKRSTKRLAALGDDRGGRVIYSRDEDAVYVLRSGGAIARIAITKTKSEIKPVKYAAEMEIDRPRERAYIFEHAWRQLARKFYDEHLHGVDWPALKRNYGAFLPVINNNHDFAELLSEMLGELNASHTGARYRMPQEGADKTAALGLLFDPAYAGPGLKVAEVLARGPADKADSKIAPGDLLTQIDGVELTPATNPWRLLDRRQGHRLLLRFLAPNKSVFEQVLKPIGLRAESNLRYLRWVRQRRALVSKLSGGRVGYVHVRSMGDSSFRTLFKEALGRYGAAEALVVDTRFNGGGWLHDDLVQFLGGKVYGIFQPRGKKRGAMGGEPQQRWARPVAVVVNEADYSDAHMFPYAFKTLGLGRIVGTPVAGTGTAVWWERQIDPTLVFGIPEVGFVTLDGHYLENLELEPDVYVVNDPNSRQSGKDPQLEKAVEVLLAQLPAK